MVLHDGPACARRRCSRAFLPPAVSRQIVSIAERPDERMPFAAVWALDIPCWLLDIRRLPLKSIVRPSSFVAAAIRWAFRRLP
jgi:hypothetical protein